MSGVCLSHRSLESGNCVSVRGGTFSADGCNMTSANGDGVYIVGSSKVVLRRNTISDCGAHGVYLWQGSADMRDNVIRSSQYHGVFVFGGCEAILDNNTVAENRRAGVFVSGTCQLHRNTIFGNFMSGLEVCRGHSLVRNNVFTRNGLLSTEPMEVASALNLSAEDSWSMEYMHYLRARKPFPAVWFNNNAVGSTCGNIVNGCDDLHWSPRSSSDILVEKNCMVDIIVPVPAELDGSMVKQVGTFA